MADCDWENLTFLKLEKRYADVTDVTVVRPGHELDREAVVDTVCVMPLQVNEPNGSGTVELFAVWRADPVKCSCGGTTWPEDKTPLVSNLGYQGGWAISANVQCGSCGAEVGPWAQLVDDKDDLERVVEEMRYDGFSREEAAAWRAAGFLLADAQEWARENFTPSEASNWAGNDLDDAIWWRFLGLTPADVSDWVRALSWEFISPGRVEDWQNCDFDVAAAAEWCQAGFAYNESGEAAEWRDAGFAPAAAAEWCQAGFAYNESGEAAEWRDAGFTPAAAAEWRDAGFTPAAAAEWRKAGFDPGRAAELREAGLNPTNVMSS